MVRMSDLIRGIEREPAKAPPARRPAEGTPGPGAGVPAALPRTRLSEVLTKELPPPPPEPAPAEVAEPVAPEAVAEPENAEALFAELVTFLAELRARLRASDAFPWLELEQLVARCVLALEHSGELFWVANNPGAPPGADYLAFHQARVAVLALRIGADIGYDRRRLVELGVAGALIDVGLWQAPEAMLRRLDALSPDEQSAYQAHPRTAADLLRRWGVPSETIVEAVLQHHEREQGQGFPQGLQGGAIHPDAKILGLVDTYTGLTVPPAARPRLRPHEAIREIVRGKHEAFAPALIKALLSEISVFPPGTLVRLNTGEVGRVIAVNRHHPLRPRVEVVADAKGQRLAGPKVLDLSEAPFLYITGPVTEGTR
jgi:hypothetical protein